MAQQQQQQEKYSCWNHGLGYCQIPFALFSDLDKIVLTEYEKKNLNRNLADYIWKSDFTKSFLAWRRRLLYCASLFLGLSSILQIGNLALNFDDIMNNNDDNDDNEFTAFSTDDLIFDTDKIIDAITQETNTNNTTFIIIHDDEIDRTTLGMIASISVRIYPYVAFFVTFSSAWFWTDYKKTRNILIPGWFLGLFLIAWPNLVPLESLIHESDRVDKAKQGLIHAFEILPSYLSLNSGLSAGARRLFTFSPSPLTGAIVVLTAAFGILIPFAALTLIVQVFGDPILLVGVYVYLLGPILVIAMNSKFTEVDSFTSTSSITACERIILGSDTLRRLGLLTILIWIVTSRQDEIQGLLSSIRIGELVVEYIADTLFQEVLWTDIVVHVARNDNLKMKKLDSDLFSN